MQSVARRRFLLRTVGSLLGVAGVAGVVTRPRAIAPLARSGPPRLRLSLAAYSFRQWFTHNPQRQPPADPVRAMDLFGFVDFCAAHRCDAELTAYYFPPEVEGDYLLRLKRHAHVRGVGLSGTAVGNRFTLPPGERRNREITLVKRWVDHAALLGAPHLRVFAGEAGTGITHAEARAWCLDALAECCRHAAARGVFLGLENHGGIVAEPDDLLDLVRAVDSPWLGLNLDTGNFHTADPYADLARCLPYAVNVQLKVEMQARGQAKQEADLPRLVRLLREGGYQGFVALEYEAAQDPWTAVPAYLERLRGLFQGG
jgi:sugar phosphate isomerase/epimerase